MLKMTENIGKLQIVIKGGKPWGFHLQCFSENRSAVIVDHIEPGGKAEIHGGLKVGDHIIKINDVLCLSLSDALQLIDSAFRTLTILVWRPSYCAQGDKSIDNGIEVQPQNFSSPPYSSLDNKLNASVFQNFKSNAVIPKNAENYTSNSNACKSEDSTSLQHHFSNFASIPAQSPQYRKAHLHKFCSKESLNKGKNNFNSKYCCNQEYLNPLLTSQSHQTANLQYICEQYPLSELFLNHKSDLKLESLASHSKRLYKTSYPHQEIGFKPVQSPRNYREISSMPKDINSSKVSECVCCMYPKCHTTYKNCKMHSPPERDFAVSETAVVNPPSSSQYMSYEPKHEERYKSNSVTACRLPEDLPSKNLNSVLHKNSLKIKEDGFKNSDLKIFKPLELSVNSKPLCADFYDNRKQRQKEIFYQEKFSHLKPGQHSDNIVSSNNHIHGNKDEKNYSTCVNKTPFQKFSKEILPEISVKHTLLVNHTEQSNLTVYGENIVQKKTVFEVCNKRTSSNTFQKNSYKGSYSKEKGHSVFLQSNKDCVEYSNEASIVKLFSTESSKSDGDEDEELCLIEENARNNNCCITPSSLSVSPDLALPSPPPDDDTEIIPSNEPLPSPPSFSPVKEVIYENIEINKRPDEAIYANLEMLKIKCSVVNSATQTSTALKNPFESSDVKSKQVAKSFSFVGTEIFSNIIAPTFGNKFTSDYLRSFLQSQLQEHSSILQESVQKSEEKYSVERHALSLPVTSAYFTTSDPKSKIFSHYVNRLHKKDTIGGELNNKKEELMSSIHMKLDILKLEQIALKEEIQQNDELGSSLDKKLGKLAQSNEIDKFRTHVEELEKITNLMLSLSGRLARAENALLILPSDASSEEKSILEEKYARLNQQYEEAKHLKKSIDRRNCQVSMFLRKYFSEEEFTDYDHFITMKAKLLIDYRELDEKIKLGEEQLVALKSSIIANTTSVS